MAYTSVLPVHRLDRSIDYVKDRTKTTKSAGSLEEAIDYALNREKTEQTIFEDAMGCTCENAYADMVKTKERFHKKDGVQGYHLVQSFAEGEVSPELAHLIGQELAEQLLKGQYEVVITTHLNTSHYHNHLVWNSVSMVDGKKYHSNAKSYFTEVRQISDQLCRKYGLSVIQTNQGKAMHYAQWKAEAEGKPTWRTVIRMDIREAIGVSFSWSQFVKEMEKRGYTWKLNRRYPSLKTPGMERYIRLRSLGNSDHRPIVGVIGDSTFAHSGLSSLINTVYNKGAGTICILDNRTTAMTGQQGNPFNGVTLQNRESNELNLPVILDAIGVDHVQVVDAFDRDAVRGALKEALGRDELDVIVLRGPCVLLSKTKDKPYYVNGNCTGCGVCVTLGCPAISTDRETGFSSIDTDMCNGCSQCAQYCAFDAIERL